MARNNGVTLVPRAVRATAVLVCLLVAIAPAVAERAAAGPVLEVTTQPALFPAFDPGVTDYVVHCDPSTPIDMSVAAPEGVSVGVNGHPADTGAFAVKVLIHEGQAFSFVVTSASAPPTRYFVRCLPSDFPTWTTTRAGTPQAEWYELVPRSTAPGGRSFAAFFDTNGVPVWWRPTVAAYYARFLENGRIAALEPSLQELAFDGTLVHETVPVDGWLDGHEARLLPNGNRLIISNVERTGVDFSSWTGATGTSVLDQQIQEFAPDGTMIWSWIAGDHISVVDTAPEFRHDIIEKGVPYDAYHMNSIEPDGEGLVVSFRHMDAVYRIDKATGALVWKLGGSSRPESLSVIGDPVFAAGGTFGGQHDARVLPDESVTVHDNGTKAGRPPRAVRYAIDNGAKTATLVEQVSDSAATSSFCCGSARKLPTGHWVASWGSTPMVAELSSTDEAAFRLTLGAGHMSYRAEPILPGVIDRAALRAGMDAQYPFTVDATASSVSASPGSVAADGSTAASVNVVLRDANRNPVAGKRVTLAARGGNSTITPAAATTDASGAATFSVTSARSGVVTYEGVDVSDSVPLRQTALLTFTQPPNAPYWLVGGGGRVFAFGGAPFFGSTDDRNLSSAVVGMASTPHAGGYWLAAGDGGVFAFGDAPFLGSMGGTRLNSPIVGMAPAPDGSGYWLVAADGGIFAFGGARFFGSTGGTPLRSPIVAMAATPDGGGYWLVASDGEVFPFGDARDLGSLGAWPLASPVVGIAVTPDGGGYTLVAADGGVFSFGRAGFFGSLGGQPLKAPISALVLSGDGGGYTLLARDGGAFSFGDAPFFGSLGGNPLTAPIVGGARAPA